MSYRNKSQHFHPLIHPKKKKNIEFSQQSLVKLKQSDLDNTSTPRSWNLKKKTLEKEKHPDPKPPTFRFHVKISGLNKNPKTLNFNGGEGAVLWAMRVYLQKLFCVLRPKKVYNSELFYVFFQSIQSLEPICNMFLNDNKCASHVTCGGFKAILVKFNHFTPCRGKTKEKKTSFKPPPSHRKSMGKKTSAQRSY